MTRLIANPNVSTFITRDNVDQYLDAGEIYIAMSSGNWWRVRRNGRTRKWKRDPNRVRIPFKAGLRVYGSITESDFIDQGSLRPDRFRHIGDLTERGA